MATHGRTDSGRRRTVAMWALVAAALVAGGCSAIEVNEAAGSRYGTAATLAEEAFPDGADVALVATARNFADALAAAPLSGSAGAPILLTESDEVPDETTDALDELGVGEVILLGGTGVISEDVEEALSQDHEVTRVAGSDRYATAANLATSAFPGGAGVALLATGAEFADALAAAPLASFHDAPILLTRRGEVPMPTHAALQELGVSEVVLLGGTAVIASVVEDQLAAGGTYEVIRIAGDDRFETAAVLAREAFPDGADVALLATGADFPDALAAAPLSASRQAPILLTTSEVVPEATLAALEDLGVSEVVLLGGTAPIGSDIEDRLSDDGYDVSRLAG